ncbi:MAG TPA: hypothetical protein VFW23_15720 [Tepidisphaeraceae bacterium]|nr:hypothetical protein [Tepidisphaeraceae bacterium]
MKRKMWLWGVVAAVGFVTGTSAMADSTLFDRGLPTANVNAGDSSRSNIAWADSESTSTPTDSYLPGDDFTLSGSGNYQVNDIRVWVVGHSAPSGLSLLGGTVGSTMSTISSSFNAVATQYAGGLDYEGSSGSTIPVYQVDFAVNLNLAAGQTFDFFVNGPWASDGNGGFANTFLAASNAAQSGSTQEGADGATQWLHFTGAGSDVESWNSGTGSFGPGTTGWTAGWDKNSDVNVQVFGAAVAPLPSSIWGGLALLGSLGLIAGAKRLRRQMA